MAATRPMIAEVVSTLAATVAAFTAFLSWMPPKHREDDQAASSSARLIAKSAAAFGADA
jgi:hypothetical protein